MSNKLATKLASWTYLAGRALLCRPIAAGWLLLNLAHLEQGTTTTTRGNVFEKLVLEKQRARARVVVTWRGTSLQTVVLVGTSSEVHTSWVSYMSSHTLVPTCMVVSCARTGHFKY